MERPDMIATSAGPLAVQPVDHASLVLSGGSEVIYVDPVGGGARYASLAKPTAILVTTSMAIISTRRRSRSWWGTSPILLSP